jgi:hypothetical protein
VYFGAAPPLPALDASAAQVAEVGARYHGTLFAAAALTLVVVGSQSLWILAAAIALLVRTAPKPVTPTAT